MKIALCLHGYFVNSGGTQASVQGAQYIKDNIIKDNNVDIFVHSWEQSQSIQDLITSTYNPTQCLFETQNKFEKELSKIKFSDFDDSFNRAQTMYKGNSPFQTLSFLYSRKQVMTLKKNHEEEAGFKYDCVVLARFGLGQRGKECPQKYYATDIRFDPSLDMNYLYSCFWDQLNWGYADHWFYSNSINMDIVGNAFDKVIPYYQIDSEYARAVTEGWPDSNTSSEFSNEMLKDLPSKHLVKWEKWHCIDNHKYYKWYFIDEGLYKKSKFV